MGVEKRLSDFFQMYIMVGGSQIHIFSLFSVLLSIVLCFLYQRSLYTPMVRLVNSFMVVTLGHFVYEDIFILVVGAEGRSIDALPIYLVATLAIISLVILSNKDHSFYFNSLLFFTLSILFVEFFGLYNVGWFSDLQLWYLGIGPDPHNLWWGISKVTGLLVVFPMLRRG